MYCLCDLVCFCLDDDEPIWVEKKISKFVVIKIHDTNMLSVDKDSDAAFVGPLPEIKLQTPSNKME